MIKIKKILTLFLICMICCLSAMIPATAATSVTTVAVKKTVRLSGYKKYKKYKATTYMNGTLYWAGALKAKFSGTTGGKYAGTKKADKITHIDSISASGIGSISVGYKAANCTISGSTANYSYTAKKTKSITNNVSYLVSKGVTFSASVTSSTQYKWGSVNYRVVCGDK